MGMYMEVVSILTSRIVYVAARPHRFTFNLGYGFDSEDVHMTTIAVLVTSAFIELIFEGAVDAYALDVEHMNGINVDEFWKMWKVNPVAFWGLAVTDSFMSIMVSYCGSNDRMQNFCLGHYLVPFILIFIHLPHHSLGFALNVKMTLWAFKLVPSYAFCTSPVDPCSCVGGGFEIYAPFCNATLVQELVNNKTQSNTTVTYSDLAPLKKAKVEYPRIFDALAEQTAAILVSVGVLAMVVVVFALARVYIAYVNAGDARVAAEMEASALREANLRFKAELRAQRLNQGQIKMINENSSQVETKVPAHLKLDWKTLKLCVPLLDLSMYLSFFFLSLHEQRASHSPSSGSIHLSTFACSVNLRIVRLCLSRLQNGHAHDNSMQHQTSGFGDLW